jgi:hypothetical protein
MNSGRSLLIAVGCVLALCAAILLLLIMCEVSTPDAVRTSVSLLVLIGPAYTVIDKAHSNRDPSIALPRYEDFSLSPKLLAVTALIAGTGILIGPPGVIVILLRVFSSGKADLSGPDIQRAIIHLQRAIIHLGELLSIIGMYLLGCWIGRRTIQANYVLVFSVLVSCRLLSVSLDFHAGYVHGSSEFLRNLVGGTVIFLLPLFFGYRGALGERWQLYLTYAADKLCPKDRDALIQLVTDEVSVTASKRGMPPS